ncbi:MAG: hypothetical protein EP330_01130 [Deltaproteobacteria bacterium]|nr:MAG: hypothetical protein EP330_01130 [Deltaproteobacteria bacterium]
MIAVLLHVAMAAPLTGRVEDPSGVGVEGVQVVVYDHRFTYGSTYTDADGGFAIDLPAGPWRVRLVPPQDRNLAEVWVPGILDICPATVFDLGDGLSPSFTQRLAPGAELAGRLVDGDGAPVTGATVNARTAETTPKAVSRRATTDADGRFAIRGLPADNEAYTSGTFALQVDLDGLPDQYVGATYLRDQAPTWTVSPGDSEDIGEFEVLPGVSVSGRVDGPDGPILIGDVSAYSPSQLVQVPISEGRYTASGLPPGAVLTWARAPGFATTYLPDADRPAQRVDVLDEGTEATGLDLTMPLESRLSGHLDAPTSLEGASVLLTNTDGTVGVAALVDADGGFVVDRLHPGTYSLSVYAADEGYLDGPWVDAVGQPVAIEVAEGDNDLGDLPLVAGSAVRGVAQQADGTPVYGATVAAIHAGTGQQFLAVTARDGSYAMQGLPAGSWRLEATYTSWCEADPDFLDVYYPQERLALFTVPVELDPGEDLDWSPVMSPDHDHDGMDDLWESENGLDPTRDDSQEDPDGDGYSNLDEFLLGSDPQLGGARECGCHAGSQVISWWLLLTPLSLLRSRR